MTKRELLQLISSPEVFEKVTELLTSNGWITLPEKGKNLSQMALTYKGREILKSKSLAISPEFVKKYRTKFPVGKKGDANLTVSNLAWLFNNYELTEDQVLRATDLYLNTIGDVHFCQQADLFIYKALPGGAIRNTILTFLEDLESGAEEMEDDEGFGCKLV